MKTYELMMLTLPNNLETVKKIINFYQNFIIKLGGKIIVYKDYGTQYLAYKIKNYIQAHYLIIYFNISTSIIDLQQHLNSNELIIRNLIIKLNQIQLKQILDQNIEVKTIFNLNETSNETLDKLFQPITNINTVNNKNSSKKIKYD